MKPSPPLGFQLADREPVQGEESLQPGDMVLLYSDGLTEARRPDGELFTEQRLAEFIERQAANGLPAPETLRGLREAIIERGERVRVYLPVGDLLPGMSYLIRRLMENTSNTSFLRQTYADRKDIAHLIQPPRPTGIAGTRAVGQRV